MRLQNGAMIFLCALTDARAKMRRWSIFIVVNLAIIETLYYCMYLQSRADYISSIDNKRSNPIDSDKNIGQGRGGDGYEPEGIYNLKANNRE